MPRSLGKALGPVISQLQDKYKKASSESHALAFRLVWKAVLAGVNRVQIGAQGAVAWAMDALTYLDAMRSGFVPLGTYHLLMKGQLSSVDSATQPDLLNHGLFGIMDILEKNDNWRVFTGVVTSEIEKECITSHQMQLARRWPWPAAHTYISSLGKVFERMQRIGPRGTLHLDWISVLTPPTTGLSLE